VIFDIQFRIQKRSCIYYARDKAKRKAPFKKGGFVVSLKNRGEEEVKTKRVQNRVKSSREKYLRPSFKKTISKFFESFRLVLIGPLREKLESVLIKYFYNVPPPRQLKNSFSAKPYRKERKNDDSDIFPDKIRADMAVFILVKQNNTENKKGDIHKKGGGYLFYVQFFLLFPISFPRLAQKENIDNINYYLYI